MAVLVAVAGAGIGASLAGSLGITAATAASWGFTIGGVVGQLLFPGKPKTEGPRLGDLSVTSSAFGAPRPVGYGTVRMGGNLIWVEDNKIKEQTIKGGKGGGNRSGDSYLYYATFAIAFSEGEADDCLRIWADGKLIFDKTSDNLETTKRNLNFRFYRGNYTQLPDPAYVASVGADQAPAFRGTVYMVFDNLELTDFGNRIPNITAEITYNKTPLSFSRGTILFEGGALTSVNTAYAAYDPVRGYIYLQDTDAPSGQIGGLLQTGIRKIRANTTQMVEVLQSRSIDVLQEHPVNLDNAFKNWFYGAPMYATRGGYLVTQVRTFYPGRPLVTCISGQSLVEISAFGSTIGDNGTRFDQAGAPPISRYAEISFYGNLQRYDILMCSTFDNQLGLLGPLPFLNFKWSSDITADPDWNFSVVRNICGGFIGDGRGEGWALGGRRFDFDGNEAFRLFRMTCRGIAETQAYGSNYLLMNVEQEHRHDFYAADLFPGATGWNRFGQIMVYCEADNSLVFYASPVYSGGARPQHLIKWDLNNNVPIWISEELGSLSVLNNVVLNQRVTGNTLGFVISDQGYLVDLNTGQFLVEELYTDNQVSGFAQAGYYDEGAEVYYNTLSPFSEENGAGRFYFRKGDGDGHTLAHIVQDVCLRAGLRSEQIDVTDLSEIVIPGFFIGNQTTARAVLDSLASVFLFDGVETDFKLKFKLRGNDAIRTIDATEIIQNSDQSLVAESRIQEVELPLEVVLNFMDRENDHLQGSEYSSRIHKPLPAMYSLNPVNLQINAALEPSMAKQQAEKILKEAWNSRTSIRFKMSYRHLDLDPGDVIQVSAKGFTATVRIVQLDWTDNFEIEVSAVTQLPGQYTSTAVSTGGKVKSPQEVPTVSYVELFPLDLPLLRDFDEPAGRSFLPLYLTALPDAPGSKRVQVYDSATGLSYQSVTSILGFPDWGTIVGIMPDPLPGLEFTLDEYTSIYVYMTIGELSSVTDQELLSGSNPAIILKANGEVEIIQYRDAVLQSNGSWKLSGLLRGRRGSDTMAYNHTAAETIIFPSTSSVTQIAVDLSQIGATRYYKGASPGQYLEDAEKRPLPISGRALKPYAPVHVAAANSSGDVVLTWIRRSRYGADVNHSYPTFLAEDTEEYEIEILDGPAGEVVRQVAGLTSPTYTYTAANQATDGQPSPMEQITVRVYQISAQAGRGFTREVTVNVT